MYLFEVVPDLDVSILDKPIGKIYFSPDEKNFDYDKQYTKTIKTQVEVLTKALEVRKEKERQVAVAQEKKKSEFGATIADGDAKLAAGKFDEAIFSFT